MADAATGAPPGVAGPGTDAPISGPQDGAADSLMSNGIEYIPEPPAQPACTQAQLRRFIKSRPYVPMHELRRRFEMNGAADDVTPIQAADGTVYVGLPGRESQFIADLLRAGDIGIELCYDPARTDRDGRVRHAADLPLARRSAPARARPTRLDHPMEPAC